MSIQVAAVGALASAARHHVVMTVPGVPTAITASAGDGLAAVSWAAPSSNGGSPIIDYTVTSTPGGFTAIASGLSATVMGLTNGTAYTFRVTARNAIGSSAASAASASVTPTSSAIDPGPTGDFFWKGLNWTKRTDPGSPQYNGNWSTANIIGPDANDYVTIRISNPSGNAPYGAEMDSTREGFGYGTYTITYSARLDNIHQSLVFGGLFTYDGSTSSGDTGVTHNEIDIHETSAWSSGPVVIDHSYFRNVGGNDTGTSDYVSIPSDTVQTHRLIWSSGRLQFDSYIGASATGTPYHSTVATNQVPVPAAELVIINIWQFDASGANMPQKDVVLQNFSFVPA